MTKEEMYAGVIKVQKTTAQGVPGNIIRYASNEAYQYLHDLVTEGRLRCFKDDTDEWFFPSTGYSIWNADGEKQQRLDMICARYHLDMLDDGGIIEPTKEQFEANEEWMLLYKTWYELHKAELEVMANLNETY
jgi:hypothetical protein